MTSFPDKNSRAGHSTATFFGYTDGDKGPLFTFPCESNDSNDRAWPIWKNRLYESNEPTLNEGGKRTRLDFKSGDNSHPLVSYITVVRNNVKTLERTILSVINQTYDNVEHIILDGASTDGTLDIVRKYEQQIDYFASEADSGLYNALNKAIPLARGQLICVLNSDDWLEPTAAEIGVKYYHGRGQSPMILTGARVRNGNVIHNWDPAFVHPGSYFHCANDCHNAIYATREAYEATGPYDETYRIAADFKWLMKALESSLEFVYTREPTVNYSLGGTSGDFLAHSKECMRVVSDRFPELTEKEVHGLYHCFFKFSSPNVRFDQNIPSNRTQFLRRTFSNHQSNPALLTCIAWASILDLGFPGDTSHPVGNRPIDLIARRVSHLLTKHPRIHSAVKRAYRALKRG